MPDHIATGNPGRSWGRIVPRDLGEDGPIVPDVQRAEHPPGLAHARPSVRRAAVASALNRTAFSGGR